MTYWERKAKDSTAVYNKLLVPQIELYQKTMGIIGLGAIGRWTARMAQGFGMKVIANSRHVKTGPEYEGIEQVSMEELLKRSDVISIHCPHTKETEHLLNREAFSKMKDGVILINTARGAIIDEEALLEALESRKVYMAGLDVVDHEPPVEQIPLMRSPYTFITSHIAWAAAGCEAAGGGYGGAELLLLSGGRAAKCDQLTGGERMESLYCYLAALFLSAVSAMLLSIRRETVFGREIPWIVRQRRAGMLLAALGALLSAAGAAAAEGLEPGDRIFLAVIFLLSSLGLAAALLNLFRNLRIRHYYRKAADAVRGTMEASEKLRTLREYVRASGNSSFRIWADGIEGITGFGERGIEDLRGDGALLSRGFSWEERPPGRRFPAGEESWRREAMCR